MVDLRAECWAAGWDGHLAGSWAATRAVQSVALKALRLVDWTDMRLVEHWVAMKALWWAEWTAGLRALYWAGHWAALMEAHSVVNWVALSGLQMVVRLESPKVWCWAAWRVSLLVDSTDVHSVDTKEHRLVDCSADLKVRRSVVLSVDERVLKTAALKVCYSAGRLDTS